MNSLAGGYYPRSGNEGAARQKEKCYTFNHMAERRGDRLWGILGAFPKQMAVIV